MAYALAVGCPQIVYNHQMFNSTDAFMTVYRDGTLKRLPKRPDQDPASVDWSTRKLPLPHAPRDLDQLPGPRSVSFGGLRFRVDRTLQYVSWMGWGMYLGFDRDMGLSLWDLRFKAERIIYEVRLIVPMGPYSGPLTILFSSHRKKPWRSMVSVPVPDITSVGADHDIAGNDPMQAATAWLDRFFGMVSSGLSFNMACGAYYSIRVPPCATCCQATTAHTRPYIFLQQRTTLKGVSPGSAQSASSSMTLDDRSRVIRATPLANSALRAVTS